jgi:hypothetical protein
LDGGLLDVVAVLLVTEGNEEDTGVTSNDVFMQDDDCVITLVGSGCAFSVVALASFLKFLGDMIEVYQSGVLRWVPINLFLYKTVAFFYEVIYDAVAD